MEVDCIMYEDIYETVVKGSNTIFLNVPSSYYFENLEDIDRESAQNVVENYFLTRGKDGIPHVTDLDFDSSMQKVKIAVQVDYDRDEKIRPYDIPDILNITRKQ